MATSITIQAVHVYLAPEALTAKLDAILNYLKDSIMDKAQLATALEVVSTALTGVGEQLTKATAEIVAALANANFTDPAIDAAVAKLQLVATGLEQASQGLDDLNADAAP